MLFEWVQIVLAGATIVLIFTLATLIKNIRLLNENLSKLHMEKTTVEEPLLKSSCRLGAHPTTARYVQSMLVPADHDNDDDLTAAIMAAIMAYEEELAVKASV